jgi:hypothetical protein
VVCLAPRALEDSVRPRRVSGVVVRPLNFTVRHPFGTRGGIGVNGNIKVAGVHRALSWLYGACSVLLFALLLQAVLSTTSEDRPEGVLVVLAIMLGVFALHRIAGRGAAQNKPWARTLSRVIAVFLLLGFPIGTAIGLYILYNTRDKQWPSAASSQELAGA